MQDEGHDAYLAQYKMETTHIWVLMEDINDRLMVNTLLMMKMVLIQFTHTHTPTE